MTQLRFVPLLLLAAAGAAQAGVVLHRGTRETPNGKTREHEVMYVQGGMIRIEDKNESGAGTRVMLFRDNTMYQLNPAQHTYVKFDKAAAQQLGDRMDQMRAQMQARMANMPPEQRARMEKFMSKAQGSKASPFTWSDTGRTEHVGQWSCQVTQRKHAETVDAEYCVTAPGNITGGDEVYSTMKQFMTAWHDTLESVPQLRNAAHNMEWIQGLKGYPVLHRDVVDGKPGREDVLTSAEKQSIPADKFEIPKDYKESQPFGHAGGDE